MTTFTAQSGRVYMNDAGGSYEIKPAEIDALLAIYDRNGAHRAWLELDEAAEQARRYLARQPVSDPAFMEVLREIVFSQVPGRDR